MLNTKNKVRSGLSLGGSWHGRDYILVSDYLHAV